MKDPAIKHTSDVYTVDVLLCGQEPGLSLALQKYFCKWMDPQIL